MKLTKVFSVFALLIATLSFAQKSSQDYSMYPKAQAGYEQKVITLKPKANENNYSVEIFVGKKMLVDTCNRAFLSGSFEEKTVEGWGYNFYQFDSKGNAASTLMACPDSTKTEKTVYAKTIQARYNSKLPVVVYVPEGYTVEYRIWKADKKLTLIK